MINETTGEESSNKRRISECVFRLYQVKINCTWKCQHGHTTFRYTRLVACRRGTKGPSAACVRLQLVCPRCSSGTWQASELHKGHSTFSTMHNSAYCSSALIMFIGCLWQTEMRTDGCMKFVVKVIGKAKAWPARHAFAGPDWGVIGNSDMMRRCNRKPSAHH